MFYYFLRFLFHHHLASGNNFSTLSYAKEINTLAHISSSKLELGILAIIQVLYALTTDIEYFKLEVFGIFQTFYGQDCLVMKRIWNNLYIDIFKTFLPIGTDNGNSEVVNRMEISIGNHRSFKIKINGCAVFDNCSKR